MVLAIALTTIVGVSKLNIINRTESLAMGINIKLMFSMWIKCI